ncbi:WD repeat-containing protein 89-like isoform X2 [Oscarella lobularis]|uniref:WD repeat-containing protein 89-like isoform X2 n=1 Tax=Oscarella lobularis TaxID=121494 RepID=UPI0033140B1C
MNSLQPVAFASFGDNAYVLHIDAPAEDDSLAAAGSNGVVRIFSRRNLEVKSTLKASGHRKRITGVRFHPENPQLVFSSSDDGCIECWDLREASVSRFYSLRYQPRGRRCFYAFDLNCKGKTLAAGTDAQDGDTYVLIWDVRHSTPLYGFEEIHSDDITQIKFHPTRKNHLLTGSTDGLMCLLDLSESDKEEALVNVFNSESSVNRAGFYGAGWDCIYCLTHVESFSAWHAYEADRLAQLSSFREDVQSQHGEKIDYLVDCSFDSHNGELMLLAGDKRGTASLFGIDGDQIAALASLSGHADVIRCLKMNQRFNPFYTGGEDGRICAWKIDAGVKSEKRKRRGRDNV